ncbi:MAG: lipoprotein signal peptidase [Bacteroidales bacterium]|nr:lipoprotein signal peptidase [Bacteroidales bacterium]
MKNKKVLVPILIIVGVILIDQILKIWVKTHMVLGEEIHIFGDRVMLKFIENPGMAFGMEFGGNWGKLALSIFRILAVGGLSWYLAVLIKKGAGLLLSSCIALIIAGALGNLIDCAFYGMIFNESYFEVAQMFPEGGGYAGFLSGNVVDMFYCPVINTVLPENFPIWGGERFIFFRPIFNIADSAITISVFIMIVFYKKIFQTVESDKKVESEVAETEEK